MARLVNHTYDEIHIGQTASLERKVTETEIMLFAALSGDVNPLHMDAAFAATTQFGERIAHGMLSGAFISAAIAMTLPGPGSVYKSQSLSFLRPVKIGDALEICLKVTAKQDKTQQVSLDCRVINQHNKVVTRGSAEVIAPASKVSIPRPDIPQPTL